MGRRSSATRECQKQTGVRQGQVNSIYRRSSGLTRLKLNKKPTKRPAKKEKRRPELEEEKVAAAAAEAAQLRSCQQIANGRQT